MFFGEMIFVNIAAALIAAFAFSYWLIATLIDIKVFTIRCRGSSKSSAVPGVASITGLLFYYVLRYHFEALQTSLWLLAVIAPDILHQLGELIFVIRVRMLNMPDKANPELEPEPRAPK